MQHLLDHTSTRGLDPAEHAVKVGLITQWFDPETGSAMIPGGIARALSRAGHDVHVITGFPNYPHGRLYDGYRLRLVALERIGELSVSRVILYPSHDRSAVRRILNFLSFMLSSATLGVHQLRSADVALVYSTPGTVGLAGLVLRRLFRKRFVLYIADLWPDTLAATGMVPQAVLPVVEPLLHRFCDAVYAAAERIVVTSPGMKEKIVARGVPTEKIEVVYNWVDEHVFKPVPRTPRAIGRFEVMYAGNIGDVQGLETAIEAMALLPEESGISLRMVGSGVAKNRLEELSRSRGISHRVTFEGPRDPMEMPALMASADIQLVCLRDEPLFHITMPSKIQAILASAQPLIVSAPGDAAALASLSGAGWAVPAGDPAALAQAMRQASRTSSDALDRMAQSGRTFYEQNLAAEVGIQRLNCALHEAQYVGASDGS